jgi:2'-5' RNA ligase
MQHRVFIAINLPEKIKRELSEYKDKWLELPCRWTKRENIHITLVFLGYLTDDEVLNICKITEEVALRNKPFSIELNKITYGPKDKNPRMIWAEGGKSEELKKLQNDLENSLAGLSSEVKGEKGRGFSPHITLGRLRQWEFRKIEPEERPNINEEINFGFEVTSIEVMESNLRKGGAEYSVLESHKLGK